MKRTNAEMERDVNVIKVAAEQATNMDSLAQITGLSKSQIKSSLANHPIIWNRIKAKLEENRKAKVNRCAEETAEIEVISNENERKKTATSEITAEYTVVLADTSAIMNCFQVCKQFSNILIPRTVLKDLQRQSNRVDEKNRYAEQAIKSKNILRYIDEHPNWLKIVDFQDTSLCVENSEIESWHWRSEEIVAMACTLWSKGEKVLLITHTAVTNRLATLQEGIIKVLFAQNDVFHKQGIRDAQ